MNPVRACVLDRWHASPPAVRRLGVGAASVLVLAVLLSVLAASAYHPVTTRTVQAAAPAPAALTDADGCPAAVQCAVELAAPADLAEAFTRWFPSGTVLAGSRTVGQDDGRRYRASLVGAIADGSLILATQCVPGGAAPGDATDHSENASIDFNGDYVVHSMRTVVLKAGGPGCSASVVIESIGADRAGEQAARALAQDPAVQLRP